MPGAPSSGRYYDPTFRHTSASWTNYGTAPGQHTNQGLYGQAGTGYAQQWPELPTSNQQAYPVGQIYAAPSNAQRTGNTAYDWSANSYQAGYGTRPQATASPASHSWPFRPSQPDSYTGTQAASPAAAPPQHSQGVDPAQILAPAYSGTAARRQPQQPTQASTYPSSQEQTARARQPDKTLNVTAGHKRKRSAEHEHRATASSARSQAAHVPDDGASYSQTRVRTDSAGRTNTQPTGSSEPQRQSTAVAPANASIQSRAAPAAVMNGTQDLLTAKQIAAVRFASGSTQTPAQSGTGRLQQAPSGPTVQTFVEPVIQPSAAATQQEAGVDNEDGLAPSGRGQGVRGQIASSLEGFLRKNMHMPPLVGSYLHYANKRVKYKPVAEGIDDIRQKLFDINSPLLLNSQQISDYWPHMTNVWMRSTKRHTVGDTAWWEDWDCRHRRRVNSKVRIHQGDSGRVRTSKLQLLEGSEACPMRIRVVYYTKHASSEEDHKGGIFMCTCLPEWMYIERTEKCSSTPHNHDIDVLDKFKRSDAMMFLVKNKAEEGYSYSAVTKWLHEKYGSVTRQAQFVGKQEVANVTQKWRQANKDVQLRTVVEEPAGEELRKTRCLELIDTASTGGIMRALAAVCKQLPDAVTTALPVLESLQDKDAGKCTEEAAILEGKGVPVPPPGLPRKFRAGTPPPPPPPPPGPWKSILATDLQVQRGSGLRWQDPQIGQTSRPGEAPSSGPRVGRPSIPLSSPGTGVLDPRGRPQLQWDTSAAATQQHPSWQAPYAPRHVIAAQPGALGKQPRDSFPRLAPLPPPVPPATATIGDHVHVLPYQPAAAQTALSRPTPSGVPHAWTPSWLQPIKSQAEQAAGATDRDVPENLGDQLQAELSAHRASTQMSEYDASMAAMRRFRSQSEHEVGGTPSAHAVDDPRSPAPDRARMNTAASAQRSPTHASSQRRSPLPLRSASRAQEQEGRQAPLESAAAAASAPSSILPGGQPPQTQESYAGRTPSEHIQAVRKEHQVASAANTPVRNNALHDSRSKTRRQAVQTLGNTDRAEHLREHRSSRSKIVQQYQAALREREGLQSPANRPSSAVRSIAGSADKVQQMFSASRDDTLSEESDDELRELARSARAEAAVRNGGGSAVGAGLSPSGSLSAAQLLNKLARPIWSQERFERPSLGADGTEVPREPGSWNSTRSSSPNVDMPTPTKPAAPSANEPEPDRTPDVDTPGVRPSELPAGTEVASI